MRFYDALQKDPAVLKSEIKKAESVSGRARLLSAMIVRAVLLVAFAVTFISSLTALFGEENSNFAVVIFCIFLSCRFVDFHYCISDSLRNLSFIFLILLVSPILIQTVNPWLGFLINVVSLLLILVFSCERPEMGNGGLYLFGYVFLAGTMVSKEVFIDRIWMAVLGYVMCALVFYFKHRKRQPERRFRQIVKELQLSDPKRQWQLQAAVGVSLLLLISMGLGVERYMWVGLAGSSILTFYGGDRSLRAKQRVGGVIAGSLLFAVLYCMIPESYVPMLGMAAGLCLGFCGQYPGKTVFNCLGALSTAVGVYGLGGSILLRILNNMGGALLAWIFLRLGQKIMSQCFRVKTVRE
mgnify:CR=1 FL=1